jgi:GTP-binding protein
VDGRSEIAGPDRDLARMLLRTGKPISLAVNKADSSKQDGIAHDFYSLGIREIFPVSSEHGIGVDAFLEHVTANFAESAAEEVESEAIKVSIIGRPNVGKSTLLNALTGQERAIVSPIAGTTRDAVDEEIVVNGVSYVFVDTAGIRRKSMARRHIRMAHVVLLVLDATEGVLGLDATIAGYAQEGGRGIIICVNKWDEAPEHTKTAFELDLRDQLKFLEWAPVEFISAKTGMGVKRLFERIREVYASASKRVTTGELNRFVESLHFEDRKIYYITQASIRPPTFVLFTNRSEPFHFSHERYLMNQIRKHFGFRGTPVVIRNRGKKNKP